MAKIKIVKLEDDSHKLRAVALIYLDDGKVVVEGPMGKTYETAWNNMGIAGRKGLRYWPKDGQDFIDALQWQYRGPYTFAEEVKEEKTEDPAKNAAKQKKIEEQIDHLFDEGVDPDKAWDELQRMMAE